MIGVKQKTVHRWADPYQVQAKDSNAEKLAEIAYEYSPTETEKVLRSEVRTRNAFSNADLRTPRALAAGVCQMRVRCLLSSGYYPG
jgi:hypothetical protein